VPGRKRRSGRCSSFPFSQYCVNQHFCLCAVLVLQRMGFRFQRMGFRFQRMGFRFPAQGVSFPLYMPAASPSLRCGFQAEAYAP
jgi:hypothetical protein